jgi:hypothetical protein
MRDPTVDVAVEAAMESAGRILGLQKRLGMFRKARSKDDPERDLRLAARGRILMYGLLPERERDVVCRMLGQERPIGRPTYAMRNRAIAGMVRQIKERGFDATRNAATRRESACSIVAKALARLGLNLSERTVEDIWMESRRRRRRPANSAR